MIEAKIGDSLKKRARGEGPENIRLVGVAGSNWVAQDQEFASPFLISPNNLRTNYGTDGADVPVVDEIAAWSRVGDRLDDSINAARDAEHERTAAQLTVEEKLAAEAAQEAGK